MMAEDDTEAINEAKWKAAEEGKGIGPKGGRYKDLTAEDIAESVEHGKRVNDVNADREQIRSMGKAGQRLKNSLRDQTGKR